MGVGLAEGTPIWLPDGRILPVGQVVGEQLPVLTYDKTWDLREPRVGRPYPPRDQAVGKLLPATPVRWEVHSSEAVFIVRLVSGRSVEAAAGQPWVVRMREGARRPVLRTTASLEPGWSVPVPLTATCFGSLGDEWDGWFVGIMLGDGNMTGRTPVWVGHDDGTLAQMRKFVERNDCELSVDDNGTWLRVRLTDPRWHRNQLRDLLIEHQVWGFKGDGKRVADLPYSQAFVRGLVSGLIDSDGSVSRNDVEFANISETLARQFSDFLLRHGGLSDAAFRIVPLLEGARDADWPWGA
ncbi:hypothetical protein GCM10010307_03440 [Streptomyces vastus]|uniref:DOD-type homing endonuclease domain-containing protein n=1 Tax=Streptomyces vastus TaxID=285451 RepID=A0ABP6CHN5_9ACTN